MPTKIITAFLIIVLSILIITPTAYAEDFGLKSAAQEAGLSQKNLSFTIGNVIAAVLSLLGVLFFGIMIYGGITWMTAQGNEENVKTALNTIIAAVIGIIVILSAYAITTFVFKGFKGESANLSPTGTCEDIAKATGLKFECMKETNCDQETKNSEAGLCTAKNEMCCQALAKENGGG